MNKVIIEICIRLCDHWYDGHGQRRDKWHACIKGELGLWACGRYVEETIDNLMDSHSHLFPNGRKGVEVHYVGRQAR